MNVARLNSLCGIGLMMVGVLGYALPEIQDPLTLLPAIGGLIMATAGMSLMDAGEQATPKLLAINAVISFVLLLYVCFKLGNEFATHATHQHIMGDTAMLAVSVIWLTTWGVSVLRKRSHGISPSSS